MNYIGELIQAFRTHPLLNTAIVFGLWLFAIVFSVVFWVLMTGFIEAVAKPLATKKYSVSSRLNIAQKLCI